MEPRLWRIREYSNRIFQDSLFYRQIPMARMDENFKCKIGHVMWN